MKISFPDNFRLKQMASGSLSLRRFICFEANCSRSLHVSIYVSLNKGKAAQPRRCHMWHRTSSPEISHLSEWWKAVLDKAGINHRDVTVILGKVSPIHPEEGSHNILTEYANHVCSLSASTHDKKTTCSLLLGNLSDKILVSVDPGFRN